MLANRLKKTITQLKIPNHSIWIKDLSASVYTSVSVLRLSALFAAGS